MADDERIHTLERDLAIIRAGWEDRNKLVDERFKAAAVANEIAIKALDERVRQLYDFRGNMEDTVHHMISRNEALAAIKSVTDACEAQNSFFRDKLESFSRPNYVLAGVFVSLATVLIGGIWTVGDLKIEKAISPLIVQIEHVKTATESNTHDITEQNIRQEAVVAEGRKQINALSLQIAHVTDQLDAHVKEDSLRFAPR